MLKTNYLKKSYIKRVFSKKLYLLIKIQFCKYLSEIKSKLYFTRNVYNNKNSNQY